MNKTIMTYLSVALTPFTFAKGAMSQKKTNTNRIIPTDKPMPDKAPSNSCKPKRKHNKKKRGW